MVESRRTGYMADAQAPGHSAEDLLERVMRATNAPVTMITSNRAVEDRASLPGGTIAVTALLDRLLHHGHVRKRGPRRWRLKNARSRTPSSRWDRRASLGYDSLILAFSRPRMAAFCGVHRG